MTVSCSIDGHDSAKGLASGVAKISVLAMALSLSACSSVAYYWQAIDGHFSLLREARPVDQILAEKDTAPALRERLALAARMREFASRELGLPDNDSYKSYADIGRPFVVWNVFAAPEFSVTPIESCFPFAGCVAYRGFFSEASARSHAQTLGSQGHDTYLGGVLAYSTLGWFGDPLLSTFVNFPEAELARVIFHELAHQVVYVRDDAHFNESFAVAVEEEGVRRWLAYRGGLGSDAELKRYQETRRRRDQMVSLLLEYRAALQSAYAAAKDQTQKRVVKTEMFERYRERYVSLKATWGGAAVFDRFFAQGANNAMLVSVAVYADHVPAFRALIAESAGNLPEFYARVKALSRKQKPERLESLKSIRTAGQSEQ
jgi:predicted aminopeptidase